MKTLKMLLYPALLGVLLMACDPNYVTTFLLKNSTKDTLSVEFYRGGTVGREITIPPESTTVLDEDSGIAGGPTMLCLGLEDSIRVSGDAGRFVYHRDSIARSGIYDFERNWSRTKHGRFTYSFTYEFTEGLFH